MRQIFQIAIDGPVAAGKGSVSKLVAEKLGFLYVDTGAMYRVATLIAKRAGLDYGAEKVIARKVKGADIQMVWRKDEHPDGRLATVLLEGEDVTWEIRTKEIDANVAKVASLPLVRKELVVKQQAIAAKVSVVMEGRDIGTVVLPGADLKIYLDAREEVRVERRVKELETQGKEVNRESVAERIRERDRLDKSRKTDPLMITKDAWYLDTSDLRIEEVAKMIVERVGKLNK